MTEREFINDPIQVLSGTVSDGRILLLVENLRTGWIYTRTIWTLV
jgi:hypothetical protein